METYDNDYSKEEDFMMWELHNIRKKLSEEGIDTAKINKEGKNYIKRNNLNNLNIVILKDRPNSKKLISD